MKLPLFLLLLFLGSSVVGFTQVAGHEIPTSGKRNSHASSVFWDNKNMVSFSRITPIGDWTKSANSLGNIKNGQAGMQKGFGFAYGQIFYLQQKDRVNPGIDVTYFDVSAFPSEGSDNETDWSFMGVFKIGPAISANPIDALILDLKFTFQPSYIYYQRTYGSAVSTNNSNKEYDFIWGDGLILRTGVAFQVRYNWLFIGAEYSWGSRDFEGQNEDYYYTTDWTGTSVSSELEDVSLNFDANRIDFYLGVCF